MRLWGSIAIILLAGCSAQRLKKEQAAWLGKFGVTAPPGTIALNDSLYYDREEASNLSWLEYEYHVAKLFGQGSPEHRSSHPDTAVWYRLSPPDTVKAEYYLRHPAYFDYPLVGISYDQAVAYSLWRSDRVMELYLIGAGIIPWRADQTADDHFTIESFYATDSLKAYHHLPYPSYALPTFSEWSLVASLSDSLARLNLPHCKKLRTSEFRGVEFVECSDLIGEGHFIINCRELGGRNKIEEIAPTRCARCKGDLVWHIRGNVSELSADSTICLGGGWIDPLDSILLDQPFPGRSPNAATGFRNVCRWRKWDGVRQ